MVIDEFRQERCICSNKDKNFKANHNYFRWLSVL